MIKKQKSNYYLKDPCHEKNHVLLLRNNESTAPPCRTEKLISNTCYAFYISGWHNAVTS